MRFFFRERRPTYRDYLSSELSQKSLRLKTVPSLVSRLLSCLSSWLPCLSPLVCFVSYACRPLLMLGPLPGMFLSHIFLSSPKAGIIFSFLYLVVFCIICGSYILGDECLTKFLTHPSRLEQVYS